MEYNAEEQIMKEFGLTEKMAKFVILVTSGVKPIDACRESYTFTNDVNAYRHLKELIRNPKVDAALKGLGMNLLDKFEKNAVAIVQAWEEIAFSKGTSTREKLAALGKLANYNPVLITNRKKDADDTEEGDLIERLKGSFEDD